MVTFGDFVKNFRIKQNITLREFCRLNDLDPSNWSKIERGLLSPPKSKQVLTAIAESLNMSSDSEDYKTLLDLAAISQIPSHLLSDQSILEKLPVFFRTLRGEKPTRKELEKILKILKDESE